MVKQFDTAYTEAKRERNVLDFNDLEHLALKVLVEKAEDTAGTECGNMGEKDDSVKNQEKDILRPSAAAK